MNWKKCASVSYGGKPYFYHLRTLGNFCINVSWNRGAKKWGISYGPNYSDHWEKLFDNPEDAKNFVEKNLYIFTKWGEL